MDTYKVVFGELLARLSGLGVETVARLFGRPEPTVRQLLSGRHQLTAGQVVVGARSTGLDSDRLLAEFCDCAIDKVA